MADIGTTVAKVSGNLAHLEQLLAAFGGSLAGWALDPEVGEQQSSDPGAIPCACGHRPIRYLFSWKKDGRTVITGSHCVETCPGITREILDQMAAGLARLRAAQHEEARKAKEALQDAEVVKLLEEIDAGMRAKYRLAYAHSHSVGWVEPSIYYDRLARDSFQSYVRHAKRLKTRAGRLRSLRGLLKELQPRGDE